MTDAPEYVEPDYVEEAQLDTPDDIKRPKALGFLNGVQFSSFEEIKAEQKPELE
jgi:hypothetical protein